MKNLNHNIFILKQLRTSDVQHTKPKKSLGQHFLIDKNIQAKIIQACDLDKGDTVLEIGPGRGEITQYLFEKAKKVIAVEIDKELCKFLSSKFSSCLNFELLNLDILKTNLVNLEGCQGRARLKVIANIPYYISTSIISHLLEYRKSIGVIYLTLQKELAKRLSASPGTKDYGAFSCFVQFHTQPKILFPIKSNSFWPKPKVDSCFVKLEVLPKPRLKVRDEGLFFKIIRLAFNQRRKLLRNSLLEEFPESGVEYCLRNAHIVKNARAEELRLSDFAKLSNCFGKRRLSC